MGVVRVSRFAWGTFGLAALVACSKGADGNATMASASGNETASSAPTAAASASSGAVTHAPLIDAFLPGGLPGLNAPPKAAGATSAIAAGQPTAAGQLTESPRAPDPGYQSGHDAAATTGVRECDEMFAKVEKCMPGMLGNERTQLKQALTQGGDAVRGQLAEACKEASAQIPPDCGMLGGGTAAGFAGQPAGGASGGTCTEYFAAMDCMASKLPPGARPQVQQAIEMSRTQFAQLGAMADQACGHALGMLSEQLDQLGCSVATGDGSAPTAGKPAATVANPPVTNPGDQSYPLGAVKTVADNCSGASVIAATAPLSVGSSYHWPWTRQAMYANKQFNVVPTAPAGTGQVAFEVIETSNAEVLVAYCADGWTCNRLAAMLKAAVRSSNPQVFCGQPPVKGTSRPSFLVPPDGYWLPAPDDTVAKCARIGSCIIASDPSTSGDPGLECQKAPASFKLACAQQDPCASVLSCLGR